MAPEERARWLDREVDADELRELLKPCSPGELTYWEVSTVVNAPANDVPECIEPVTGDDPPPR